MRSTRDALKLWNKQVFGELQTRISSVVDELDALQCTDGEALLPAIELSKRRELLHLQKMEEDLCCQKSCSMWLTMRDLNTKFFHLSTIIRRRRNSIDSIKTVDGTWLHDRTAIGMLLHLCEVFASGQP